MAEQALVAQIDAAVQGQINSATQWQLMWWRFRKHKPAMVAGVVLILFYVVAIFAEFVATTETRLSDANRSFISPQPIHFFDGWKFSPHVFPVAGERDPVTFIRVYTVNSEEKIPIRLFAHGFEYKFLGVIRTDRHLFGVPEGFEAYESMSILGTDKQGRDLWSRLILATRVSMTIGLAGVGFSLILGVFLGGISGFYGGIVDTVVQRIIEIVRSVPTIPLWMGLAASLPRDWSVLRIYFAITIIISLFAWTELARVVRGRFLSLRDEDFVTAAELSGASRMRIIFRHMVPSFMSHIIAATTLAVPEMIISETALSFLGLGLRPPAVSFGVLLQQAQNIQTVALSPWLMLAAVPVIIAVLAFNFLGDGLRDAADPYG
ncbi:MAG: ABC transporter permease [Chloroflexi bacterium]|nr:ABC transporter permease [Chloroflexota bacterium]